MAADPEAAERRPRASPCTTSWAKDIGYPINTKRSSIRGRLSLTEEEPPGLVFSGPGLVNPARDSFRRPELDGRYREDILRAGIREGWSSAQEHWVIGVS